MSTNRDGKKHLCVSVYSCVCLCVCLVYTDVCMCLYVSLHGRHMGYGHVTCAYIRVSVRVWAYV